MDWVGLGWIGMGLGWDLCVGLLYEHRFAVLIITIICDQMIIIFGGFKKLKRTQEIKVTEPKKSKKLKRGDAS